jgi:hypothetical protein
MFGRDTVDTDKFVCPACKQEVFRLYDVTPAGSDGRSVNLAMKCANMNCQQQYDRIVMPTMNEQAASGNDMPVVPGRPQHQLSCDKEGVPKPAVVRPDMPNPHSFCLSEFFRVKERGNELLSGCPYCGKQDSLGMINAALR